MSLNFLFATTEFKDLRTAAEKGEKGIRIQGVTDAARPYVLACLASKLPKRLVCVRPPSRPLTSLVEDCRFFLSRLRSTLPAGSLPALSDDPYLEIPPSLDAVSSRMRFLWDALHGSASLIVTNPFGLLKPLPAPADLERSFLTIEVGRATDRDDILRTLSEYGYSREDLIASPGEYAWRGGIIDVFPPWQSFPFRI
ncbi:MAG: transcription-repair coupling factor, partial [Candidatus Aminicenantes bacterium]|nr:transcription-repair coupling factor [Candidatus Aminicenantes bacterium]